MDILLILLAFGGGWVRFKVEPYGHLALSSVAIFVAFLRPDPSVVVMVASFSGVLSSVAFRKLGLLEALDASLGDGLAALLALVALKSIALSLPGLTIAYTAAVVVFVAARLLTDVTVAYFLEGIAPTQFAMGAAWKVAANLSFLAAGAYLVETFLYGKFGFLALILATLALTEIYQPWKLLSDQNDVLFASLAMVAQAIDIKDPYTARHSRNVAKIAVRIARAMRLSEDATRKIRIGALMHDIGKVGVSGIIIRKPAALEPHEATAMRAHPIVSADIMQPIEFLTDAAEIVRHHHEHYDGSGYPDGLAGEQIPIGSRVILVADALDALTSDRPYRRGRSQAEAIRVLRQHAGKQFDPAVVSALESVLHLL